MNLVRRTRRVRIGEDIGKVLLGGVSNYLCAPDAQLPHALSVDAVSLIQADQVSSQFFNAEVDHGLSLHNMKACEDQ